jgi:two-component sensor histidine kinase
VRRSGVKVTANVAIPTQNGPFGVLEVDSREEREFLPDDIDFLRTYSSLLGAAVERQRATSLVQILMQELQHRVKNDLQAVTAMLTLESLEAQSPETRTRLESVTSRVEALHLIHEHLLASGRIGQVDLAGYLRELCRRRFHMHDLDPDDRIQADFRLAPVIVEHNQAVTIGIVVNEFVTNSLKHAFPTGQGCITVALEEPKPGLLQLVLADNGVGMPTLLPEGGLEGDRKGSSRMGVHLIDTMVRYIGGTIMWSNEGGTRLTLRLPAG